MSDEMEVDLVDILEMIENLLRELENFRFLPALDDQQKARSIEIQLHLDTLVMLLCDMQSIRLPPMELRRRSWQEYRTEKIDAGVFDRLFRMSPERFDKLFALVEPELTRDTARCASYHM